MNKVNVYKKLGELNELSPENANAVFLAIGGPDVWASSMAAGRPYSMIESLFTKANETWFSLSEAERIKVYTLDNFRGDSSARNKQELSVLNEAFRLYENKFGFIFVVQDIGIPTSELLAMCKARFGNSLQTELLIAAQEYRKRIEFRLTKYLEQ